MLEADHPLYSSGKMIFLEPSQGDCGKKLRVCVCVMKNKELRGQQSPDEAHSSIHLTRLNYTQAPGMCDEYSDLSEVGNHIGGIFLSLTTLSTGW